MGNLAGITSLVRNVSKFLNESTLIKSDYYSLIVTIAGLVLPCAFLLRGRGSRRSLPLALASCALSFFLFSFHVHEKTILFPLLPLGLLAWEFPRLVRTFTLVALARLVFFMHQPGLVFNRVLQYATSSLP